MVLLDLIRYHQHLMGAKIGCREGDCGACTVLVGQVANGNIEYRSMTSCLVPLANADGKHIVTVEGINFSDGELNPIQKAMADEGATQCGFCTPGFIMSLAGFCLGDKEATKGNAIAAVDGNICRCTGYKSIERACGRVAETMKKKNGKNILPPYFSSIKKRLLELNKTNGYLPQGVETGHALSLQPIIVGGGTDLYVQKHDELIDVQSRFVFDHPELNGISKTGNRIFVGPSATVTDLKNSKLIQDIFPDFDRHAWLVSSTPIRNMATIAGNFVNASPIGDFTIFFLALNAQLILTPSLSTSGEGHANAPKRELPLRKFYKGYKQLDKNPEEYIEQIWFELPGKNFKPACRQAWFNFEKVSKRTNLDIASVNSAIAITMNVEAISEAAISAGGVGPTPLFLKKASGFLEQKKLSEELIHETIEIAQTEISPISDARGSAEYKRLLLGQLIKAHFIQLFPGLKLERLLVTP